MQFKHPGQLDRTWEDTAGEMPAILPQSGALNWHADLPKPTNKPLEIEKPLRKIPLERPYWDVQPKKPADYEKMAARITWICMGFFALLIMLICMGKILLMTWALK